MNRESNDGQELPARCFCCTFACLYENWLVRTHVATHQPIYEYILLNVFSISVITQ